MTEYPGYAPITKHLQNFVNSSEKLDTGEQITTARSNF